MATVADTNHSTGGYTLAAVAARLGKIENAAWFSYTALVAMAMNRGCNKKNLQNAVFGKDEQATANFNKGWTLGQSLFSRLSPTQKATMGSVGIEEAATMAEGFLTIRMTELGAKSRRDFEARKDYDNEAEFLRASKQGQEEAEAAKLAEETAIKERAEAAAVAAEQARIELERTGIRPELLADTARFIGSASLAEIDAMLDLLTARRQIIEAEARARDEAATVEAEPLANAA